MTHDQLIAILYGDCDIATKQRAIDSFAATAGTHASLQSCSLSGLDLSGLCFAPLELIGVEMTECLIRRARFGTLSQCALDDSRLDSCDAISIRDCTLNRTHLICTSVQHEFHRNVCVCTTFEQVAFGGVWTAGSSAAIERSLFDGATISGSWLSGLFIDGCGFESSRFVDSTLARTAFLDCSLRGACATRCNFIDTSLERCILEGMRSESCVVRTRDVGQSVYKITGARLWSDEGVDRMSRVSQAIGGGGNFRLRWVMRGRQWSAVSGMMLWLTGGEHSDGAIVWTRDREVVRVYPFQGQGECEAALANWWRDCADWVYVPDSLEADSVEGSSQEVAHTLEDVLRAG
ncbi:MAG: pentapeptide repeat-containing protein [Phycisphaeraceae bacterium]|nr:pentapeptide repeat-containing protein [Phycisphaeraceae bacterium]